MKKKTLKRKVKNLMSKTKTEAGTKRMRGGPGSLIGEGARGKLKQDEKTYKKRLEALQKARAVRKMKMNNNKK